MNLKVHICKGRKQKEREREREGEKGRERKSGKIKIRINQLSTTQHAARLESISRSHEN
jgi:hypothetical protein